MQPNLSEIKSKAKANQKKFNSVFNQLERKKSQDSDVIINEMHEEVFSCTDCLTCANCCKTTGPLFTKRDIKRISSYLQITEAQFEIDYLRVDEEEDFVLKKTPCAFLNLEDNMCNIYEVRPQACASYPHTDMRDQMKIKKLTLKNTGICPAVYDILDRIDHKLKKA